MRKTTVNFELYQWNLIHRLLGVMHQKIPSVLGFRTLLGCVLLLDYALHFSFLAKDFSLFVSPFWPWIMLFILILLALCWIHIFFFLAR